MTDEAPKTKLEDLRLFKVQVSVEFDIAVFAQDEEEARKVATRHWHQELQDGGIEPDLFPEPMTEQTWTHGDCDPDSLPWAPDGTVCEDGCENPQRTLQEYLEERGLA